MSTQDSSHDASRRTALLGAAGLTTALSMPLVANAQSATAQGNSVPQSGHSGASSMSSYVTTKDNVQIYFKDWGKGQPIVFSHGWPLTADDWDNQMMYFLDKGFRVIAHDRRGHGRSSQTWSGNDMDHYADDLATLVEKLNLKDVIHVGHSAGGGEVARYIGRHGTKRVSKAVLISAVTPAVMKSATNPGGAPMSVFDGLRSGIAGNRSEFYQEVPFPFYGFNRPGAKDSQGLRQHWWLQGMTGAIKAQYDCVKAFSEIDFTEDLRKFNVPTLILHGEDDQIVPVDDSARLAVKLIKGATLKTYPGLPHGMCSTHPEIVNADLLAFFKS